jgi:hypothetical protein
VVRTLKNTKNFPIWKKEKKKKNFTILRIFSKKKAPGNVMGYKLCWAVLDFYEETPVSAL